MGYGRVCVTKFYACNDEAKPGSKLMALHKDGYYYLPMIGIADVKPQDPNIQIEPEETFGFYFKVDEYHYKNISQKCDDGTYTSATQWGTGQELKYDKDLKIYYVEVMYVV